MGRNRGKWGETGKTGSQCSGNSIGMGKKWGENREKRGLEQGQGSGNSIGPGKMRKNRKMRSQCQGNSVGLGVIELGRGRISGLGFRGAGGGMGGHKGAAGEEKGDRRGHMGRSGAIPVNPSGSQWIPVGPVSVNASLALCHLLGPSQSRRGPSQSILVSPRASQSIPAWPSRSPESRLAPVNPSRPQFVPVPPQRPRPRSPQSRGLPTPRLPALIGGLASPPLGSHWVIHLSLNVIGPSRARDDY